MEWLKLKLKSRLGSVRCISEDWPQRMRFRSVKFWFHEGLAFEQRGVADLWRIILLSRIKSVKNSFYENKIVIVWNISG